MSVKGFSVEAEELGSVIKAEIVKAGYRQVDFARKLGLSPSRLSNYINGIRLPDFFILCRMAKELNISIENFNPSSSAKSTDSLEYVIKIYGRCSVVTEKI